MLRAATELNRLLTECNFPSICIHGRLKQDDRIARYQSFKACEKRILVTTDLMGRGIDIEKVNVVINYDFPDDSDYATGSVRFKYIYIYVVSYDWILYYYNSSYDIYFNYFVALRRPWCFIQPYDWILN